MRIGLGILSLAFEVVANLFIGDMLKPFGVVMNPVVVHPCLVDQVLFP